MKLSSSKYEIQKYKQAGPSECDLTYTYKTVFIYCLYISSDTSKCLEGPSTKWEPLPAPPQTCPNVHSLSHLTPPPTLRITRLSPCFWWETRFWEVESFTSKLGSNSGFRVYICSSHTKYPLPLYAQFLESILSLKLTKPSPTPNTDMVLSLMTK